MLSLIEYFCTASILLYFLFDIVLICSLYSISTKPKDNANQKGISVIIAAKNEYYNLKKNLPTILSQHYSTYEVVVINDQSTDSTPEILNKYSSVYPNLQIHHIPKDVLSSKKHALAKGIEKSQYEQLVFTDADCEPASSDWLRSINNHFTDEVKIVLGYSPYQKKGQFLNQLIRFETIQTAINFFGFAKLGMPYMGVGRNLAYTKAVYHKVRGFLSHGHILSGDDDLLINQAAAMHKISLNLEADSFVFSAPKENLRSWLAQKQRHISTAPHYKKLHKFILGIDYTRKVLFWYFALPMVIFVIKPAFTIFNSFLLLFLLTSKILFSRKIYQKFFGIDLWLKIYLFELVLINLQLLIYLRNLFSPPKTW